MSYFLGDMRKSSTSSALFLTSPFMNWKPMLSQHVCDDMHCRTLLSVIIWNESHWKTWPNNDKMPQFTCCLIIQKHRSAPQMQIFVFEIFIEFKKSQDAGFLPLWVVAGQLQKHKWVTWGTTPFWIQLETFCCPAVLIFQPFYSIVLGMGLIALMKKWR